MGAAARRGPAKTKRIWPSTDLRGHRSGRRGGEELLLSSLLIRSQKELIADRIRYSTSASRSGLPDVKRETCETFLARRSQSSFRARCSLEWTSRLAAWARVSLRSLCTFLYPLAVVPWRLQHEPGHPLALRELPWPANRTIKCGSAATARTNTANCRAPSHSPVSNGISGSCRERYRETRLGRQSMATFASPSDNSTTKTARVSENATSITQCDEIRRWKVSSRAPRAFFVMHSLSNMQSA